MFSAINPTSFSSEANKTHDIFRIYSNSATCRSIFRSTATLSIIGLNRVGGRLPPGYPTVRGVLTVALYGSRFRRENPKMSKKISPTISNNVFFGEGSFYQVLAGSQPEGEGVGNS
jgi:hypothetical protein